MQSPSGSQRFRLLGLWGAVCLVFFALPMLLLAFGFGRHWTTREQEARQEAFSRMENIAREIRTRDATEKYLEKSLDWICARARDSGDPVRVFRKELRKLLKRFPGVFSLAGSFRGALIPGLTSKDFPDTALFLKAMSILRVEGGRPQRYAYFLEHWAEIRSLFGADAFPDLVFEQFQLMFPVSDKPLGKIVYYFHTPDIGFMAFLQPCRNWESLPTLDRCRLMARKLSRKNVELGVFDPEQMVTIPETLKQAWQDSLGGVRRRVAQAGFLTLFQEAEGGAIFWMRLPFSRGMNLDHYRLALTIVLTALFSVLATMSFLVMTGRRVFYFSIALRLRLLFIFAAGLPVLVMGMFGWDYLNQTRQTLLQRKFDEAERIARGGDLRLRQIMGWLENRMNRDLNRLSYRTQASRERLHGWIRDSDNLFRSSQTGIYDAEGNYLIDRTPEEIKKLTRVQTGRKHMAKLVGTFIRKLNAEDRSDRVDPTELMMESISGLENPLQMFARNMNHLSQNSTRDIKNWLYLRPLHGAGKVVTHLLVSYWGQWEIWKGLVPALVQQECLANKGWRVYAGTSGGLVPANGPLLKKIRHLLKKLQTGEASAMDSIPMGENRLIVAAVRSRELDLGFFLAMTTDRSLQETLGQMWRAILLVILGCLLIAGFLGNQLSERFLKPVRALSLGVEAIEQRRFSYRLPPGENDEMGDLGVTFNRALEDMVYLEVARIVQESLVSHEEVRSGDYRIFGKTLSATEVGGDYLDFQRLPDGRIMIFLGDVTGHGVPAALIMAMVKALVEREILHGCSPFAALTAIHHALVKTLKRKRMMTAFMGLLDPREHRLSCWPAGQTFPMVLKPGVGEPYFLEIPAFPLGSLRKPVANPVIFELAPGDRVLFYTDGLTEARDRSGEIIDESLIRRKMTELIDTQPQDSCERVLTWHRSVTGDRPQDDDISVMILTREKSSGSD